MSWVSQAFERECRIRGAHTLCERDKYQFIFKKGYLERIKEEVEKEGGIFFWFNIHVPIVYMSVKDDQMMIIYTAGDLIDKRPLFQREPDIFRHVTFDGSIVAVKLIDSIKDVDNDDHR